QTTVDQLARAARGPGGEVAGLDQPDGQAAGRGVEGGTRADDAAADDEDVERAAGRGRRRQRLQRALAGLGGQRDRPHGPRPSWRHRQIPGCPARDTATLETRVTPVNTNCSTWSNAALGCR